MRRCLKILILILLLFCHPAFAFAEDTADIGEIRVSAEAEHESAEAPSSFTTIIRPEREHAEFENLSELVSKAPGVTARSLGGLGQFSTVSIRGSSPEQVSVYLDGIRMNTEAGGAFDFSTIPVDFVERIEVIRGGGTAQFGSDAIGGVINIVTKKAGRKRAIEAFGGGGSFTTMKLGLSYREPFKKNSLTFSWAHLQSKGDYTFRTNPVLLNGAPSGLGGGEVFTRIHNAFVSESLLAEWGHRFSDRLRLDILNDFYFTDSDVPGTEEETTILYPANPLDARERIFRNANSIVLSVTKFFIDEINFKSGLATNFSIDHFDDATPAIGGPIDEDAYYYSLGPYFLWLMSFKTGHAAHLVTFRYDYSYDYTTETSPIRTAVLTGTHTRQMNSVFVQDEASFLNDRLLFIPSVRFEDASDFPADMAYRGGLKIFPVKWASVKANFERSYRYPNFNELYFPDQGYLRGNPNLEKEKAWNLDAGVNLDFRFASLEAAYFRNWVDNSIIFVPISATTIAPVNTYKVDIAGVETAVTINPVKYVSGWANYTYLDAHYASNANQLPGRPKHEFNSYLSLNYEWSKKLGGSIFGRFNYKYNFPINPANTVFLAATSNLDLGFNLRFAKYYYILFEAKDITNVQMYDVRGFPLPRRSFFGTLGAKWG